ncbi:MAG: thioesterase, partial [Marinobacter sp. 34-60-7]
DLLQFDVGLTDFNRYGGDFVFRVTKAETGQPVALAKYGFVFFNYQTREVSPLPESFRARFA